MTMTVRVIGILQQLTSLCRIDVKTKSRFASLHPLDLLHFVNVCEYKTAALTPCRVLKVNRNQHKQINDQLCGQQCSHPLHQLVQPHSHINVSENKQNQRRHKTLFSNRMWDRQPGRETRMESAAETNTLRPTRKAVSMVRHIQICTGRAERDE